MKYDMTKLREAPEKWLVRTMSDDGKVEEQESFGSKKDAEAALAKKKPAKKKPAKKENSDGGRGNSD